MIYQHVHISRSNQKLGAGIPSVNLPPCTSCRQNAPCYDKCYARKGHFVFKNVRNAMAENFAIWKNEPDRYESDLKIAAWPSRFFRFHSAGDIPDAAYLRMMVRIANELPQTHFLAFTKQYELVNAYISAYGPFPTNLSIVLSAWGDSFMPENPHNLPVAYVQLKNKSCTIPDDAMQCSGYCGNCVHGRKNCWTLKSGESVVFKEH